MPYREIHILPNNRVAAIAAPELLVYDYSSLDYVDHIPQHRLDHFELTPPMKCLLWLTPSNPMVSTPYEAQGGVHFFVVTKQTAQSIFIPDEFGAPGSSSNLTLDNFGTPGFSSPGLLRVQTLMHVPRHKYRDPFTARYSLGRSRAVLHYPNHETTSFEFFLLHYEQMFAPDYIPVVKVIPCKARSKRQQEQAVNPEPNPSLSAAWEYAMPYRNLLLDEGTGRVVVPFEKRFGLVDFALVHKYSSTS
ncbi:hypothetical protein CPC08DRAFT_166609 [Agrocybe pediades]|nr:hypothetical protein CPC08DRAFT_166609 [Agrocybe pediades]